MPMRVLARIVSIKFFNILFVFRESIFFIKFAFFLRIGLPAWVIFLIIILFNIFLSAHPVANATNGFDDLGAGVAEFFADVDRYN